MVDFVRRWAERTEITAGRFISWLGIQASKYYAWCERYGKVNEHNGWIPRDWWLEDWEKKAILEFHDEHPLEGYRRLAFMMIDQDVVAVSPTSVYRVLRGAGVLGRRGNLTTSKGRGFEQPLAPHQHWHIDVSHLNICGTFYYLFSVLDGYSRFIVDWEIRESMKEADIEIILQRAREKFPDQQPRVISDNGPQFVAKDFKQFIRLAGMTHVRTSPFYPQSNGKKERFFGSLKRECIRPRTPVSLADARRVVGEFVEHYNRIRLHSAIGYVAPLDKLEGRDRQILAERDRKLEGARARRAEARARNRAELAEARA